MKFTRKIIYILLFSFIFCIFIAKCKRYYEYFNNIKENYQDEEKEKNEEENDVEEEDEEEVEEEEDEEDDEEDEEEKDVEENNEKEEDIKKNNEEEEDVEKNNEEEENFVVYGNSDGSSQQIMNNNIISGYNYDDYSDYKFSDTTYCLNPNGNKDMPIPLHNNYIFPPRRKNNTDKIKYASKPWLLQHECDVNRKILEYESADVYPDFYPKNSYTNRSINTRL